MTATTGMVPEVTPTGLGSCWWMSLGAPRTSLSQTHRETGRSRRKAAYVTCPCFCRLNALELALDLTCPGVRPFA